ncbi:hypothetical protein LCGC14_1901350 [marine sediment metagenome]|uniref:Uncharacterized protein n=1 Tax=marine sediment metagenome TaxID=412755 RepID=A0A0F9GJX4_9ZZZZ
MKWRNVIIKYCEQIEVEGGKLEFIVYKRQDKRKPIIRVYPNCEINCEEEKIIE